MIPGQLELFFDVGSEPELDGWCRLGETAAYGGLLLGLLRLNGWEVKGPDDPPRAFAGEGTLIIARNGPFEVVGEHPVEVFKEAARLRGAL